MGKTKIALIIMLLIVSALLIVTLLGGGNSESEISAKQVESKEAYSQLESIKPDSQEVTIDKPSHKKNVYKTNDVADNPEGATDEESPPSGLDIMTNQEHLAQRFNNEGKDYHWSGYWENELQTIVLFVGAKAFVKDSEVECNSSTCEVTVNLSVNGPENTVIALESLSQEFAQRELKFVPESIDPADGKVVFYTQPGDIPE